MGNRTILDNVLTSRVATELAERLPQGWRAKVSAAPRRGTWRPDALLEMRSPDGVRAVLLVEAKQSLLPKDVTNVTQALRSALETYRATAPLLVAPFLSPGVRERLDKALVNYLDLTGNIRIALNRPAVFIESKGADENPDPENRPVRSLKGAKAGRIVRALSDFRPPVGIRQLANRAGADPGYTTRVLTLLEEEDLVRRRERGPVEEVDWQALLRRWARDYSLIESNLTLTYLEPRGLEAFTGRLSGVAFPYALTGSLAAARVAPVAPSRLATCYVEDPEAAAKQLELRPAETGGNVLLVAPFDPVVYERANQDRGLNWVAYSQCAADLLTSPGRGPAEADALIEWMASNEDAWRS